MDYQNEKSNLTQKNLGKEKKEHVCGKLAIISLKDMPIETRRKEAKKPLFLTRYE